MVAAPVPQNYHALYDRSVLGPRGVARPEAVGDDRGRRRLAEDVPDVQVDVDDVTGQPVRVASVGPAAPLAPPADAPEEAVRAFVDDRRDLWNLRPNDVDTVEVRSVSRSGLRTVRLVQRVDGAEVFNSDVTVALDSDNAVLAVSGQLFAGVAESGRRTRGRTGMSTEEAIAAAAFDLTRLSYPPGNFELVPGRDGDGRYRWYTHRPVEGDRRPAFGRDVRVKDVLFPLGGDQFASGVYLELWIEGFPPFSYVIDTIESPRVLFRQNLRAHAAFTYRVHNTGDEVFRPEDGPAPGSPHPTGIPDGFQAPTMPERLVTLESLLPGDPWLPDDATTTRGNNCIAYADLRAPEGQSPGDIIGKTTSSRTFDYTYDHSKDARDPTNLQNSIVGMFFHVNWLHDRWYTAGFDEAAGNAQEDNFGRGGEEGDPILAEGHDFSGTDNANMETPADGSSPRMQMYEFLGPQVDNPTRTSNHEALITFHEMGHYITNRLVGDAAGLSNRQGGAMGEGWGDFFAVCMTSQAGDDCAGGCFPTGGWTDLRPTFTDNYYFSIRRYPYSARTDRNPLTFRHISQGEALPEGPPINPDAGGPNHEVHNAGEVWCQALWEVFVNLVARHGHAEAERRMLLYVVGGLEQTPIRPTYTQARDGIITAVSAFDVLDLVPVWQGFAKRGMGVDAASPRSDSRDLRGVVESFDVPAGLPREPPEVAGEPGGGDDGRGRRQRGSRT